MKVRIGVGAAVTDPAALDAVAAGIVRHRLDSLWLSEVLTGRTVDPIVGLAWAAARHPTLKVGTTMLLPGRHPVRTAKALASLDRLTGGRLLLTAVPGLALEPERGAVGEDVGRRGAAIESALPLLRRLWAGEEVTWDGRAVHLDGVSLEPRPVQAPLEVWLGGTAPGALRRCGRLGDGWLPSLCSPDEAEAGRRIIEAEAAAVGRAISPEHYGVSVGYVLSPLGGAAAAALRGRRRGVDVEALVPVGWAATRELLQRYLAGGFSKFVLRPLVPPADWSAELDALAAAVGDLQT